MDRHRRVASLEQVMASYPIHPRSINSKRAARRLILFYCDSKSLRALRLVSRDFAMWTSEQEHRYFRDIRITLNLGEGYRITPANWDALRRMGKSVHRVIFILATKSGRKKIEFKHHNSDKSEAARISTLNPLPREGVFDSRGQFSLVKASTPVLEGIFQELDGNEDEPNGLFKRVFDLVPNMQSLSLRDQVIWEGETPEELEADWGRTLVDEALIYIRCQLEESLLARLEELNQLKEVSRLEGLARIKELAALKRQATRKYLTQSEGLLLARLEDMSRLDAITQSEELTRIKEVDRRKRLIRLVQLEESLMTRRKEVAQLKEQVRLPKLLDMQVGSPLALWHFRAFPRYGTSGDPFRRAGIWGTIKTLNISLPAIVPGRTYSRKRIVKKAIYDFLAEFSERIEVLSISFISFQNPKDPTTATKAPAETSNGGNPLTYDLDPEFGGGGEITLYPTLKKLSLNNMCLAWKGGLKEFFVERAPSCIDVVLKNCTFVSDQDCIELYGLFELQNAQRLKTRSVPLVLTRKLRLPGARGFRTSV